MGIRSIFRTGNKIPDNSNVEAHIWYGPSQQSRELASSMAIATNTASPMSRGVPDNGVGFIGDRGYGVNRFAGEIIYAVQNFYGVPKPVVAPLDQRLGFGAGVAGQPGLPSTGQSAATDLSLGLMSMGQVGPLGYQG